MGVGGEGLRGRKAGGAGGAAGAQPYEVIILLISGQKRRQK